jgi:hypothetical protein
MQIIFQMKLVRAAFAAALLSASAVVAFQPPPNVAPRMLSRLSSSLTSETELSPCATPDIIPESVTTKSLRSAILTNADGEFVNLGDKMGKGTSIVVFLRHLG